MGNRNMPPKKEKPATGTKRPAGKAEGVAPASKKVKPAGQGKKSGRLSKKEWQNKAALNKAKRVQMKVVNGPHGTRVKRIRTNVRFRRPKVLHLPRNPKYPRKSTPNKPKMDSFSMIRYPLTTEAAMKMIEDNNTLVFIVDRRANKNHIKAAVKKLYEIDATRVATLHRPDGLKKAYVKLAPDYDALDVANKIGII